MEEQRVHSDYINASNPFHECVEYCFRKIAEANARKDKSETGFGYCPLNSQQTLQPEGSQHVSFRAYQEQNVQHGAPKPEENSDDDGDHPVDEYIENEARKANQTAMVVEKKRMVAFPESRGISKQKCLDGRKKKIGKLLDANGLDLQKAYMLDTQGKL
ncbi:hypothetical protein V6N11_027079 [Hibiscus sabdariffa]|uniref:Uncharacterized protein n=1 Tax=Hibiscus sabdariffa TaxID=183260 RepID=A0ABR2PFY8_9ROSI